jgi:sugar phosphate isomerase/epimerase
MHTRRDFLQLAAASLPGCAVLAASAAATTAGSAGGVRIGVQTYSLREMLATPGDMTGKMIAAMRQLRLTECEMFEPCMQPAELANAPGASAHIEAVRNWRLGPGLNEIEAHAAKLKQAGIRVFAFNFSLSDSCSDAEIERGIQMTRALGAQIMTASTTLTMAKRSIPFFEKHDLLLALHGHSNLSDPNQFATPASFESGLAMSKLYRVNLDIGHFFAAGFDPIAFIQTHHERITNLHIKDRKQNDGPNMPFGQGDTPITAVLQLLKRKHYPIPAYLEYEYAGKGNAVEELAKCLAYVEAALTTTR